MTIEPPFKLTKFQREWWDWAIGGQAAMVDDTHFTRDMPEFAVSEHLHRLDMLYRIECQAPDIAETIGEWRAVNALERFADLLRDAWSIPEESWTDLAEQDQ